MGNKKGKGIGAREIGEGIERVASGEEHCVLYNSLLWLLWQTVTEMKLSRC